MKLALIKQNFKKKCVENWPTLNYVEIMFSILTLKKLVLIKKNQHKNIISFGK